jgi:hypothetical protein
LDLTANLLKRCTSVGPYVFVSVEGGGGGAPTNAEYLVGAADATLSAERVVTDTATGAWDLATPGQAKVNVPDNAITNLKLRDSAAVSVIGRAANSSGDPADIAAAADAQFLSRHASALAFAALVAADLPSHQLDGSVHTISGKTAGQFMRATAATTFAFEAIPFARGGTVVSPAAAINVIVWRAPFACTVTAVKGYRVGGTGATINARRNGASNHLASDLSLTSADTWTDGGAVQNTAYAAGDKLEIMIQSITGAPTQVAVQVEFTRP